MVSDALAGYDDAGSITYEAVSVSHYFLAPAKRLVSYLELSPDSRLLDVGAGSGALARIARGLSTFVIASDPALRMLLQCLMTRDLSVVGRLPHLPFHDASFTHISAGFVLSHLSDPPACLAEARRVLKPAGLIGVTSWAVGPSETEAGQLWSEAAAEFLDQTSTTTAVGGALPFEQALRDLDSLLALLMRADFTVRLGVQETFPIAISVSDYLRSRAIGICARHLKAALPSSAWRQFESTVRARIQARFGHHLQFETHVNLAVAMSPIV